MSCCKSFLDCLPVLSILALLSWSYYAYVVELCIYTIKDLIKKILFLLVYHTLFTMFMWTYFKIMCADIAIVPIEFKVPVRLYERIKMVETDDEKNDLLLQFCYVRQLNVVTRTEDGYIRFCNKCKHVKPDRAHHCSACGTCVLKMDHHCPWVNNCVGFSNYKFFMLFLSYASLYCGFYFGTTLEYFIRFWRDSAKNYCHLHIVIGLIVACSMGILVLSFCCYHLSMISKNKTTLEILREPTFRSENLTFDIGTCQNFTEVFGNNYFLWFIPIQTTYGNGIVYPMRLMI